MITLATASQAFQSRRAALRAPAADRLEFQTILTRSVVKANPSNVHPIA